MVFGCFWYRNMFSASLPTEVHGGALIWCAAWHLPQHPCAIYYWFWSWLTAAYAACGTELVTWFALCLGKSNTHTECQVCFIFVPLPLSPTATARRLCLYACLLESTEARPLMNSNAHTLILPSILPFLPFFSSLWITGHPQPLKEEPTSALDMISMMWS